MADDTTPGNAYEFSVSELSMALKRTVEDTYGYVRVRGELGRVSRPASGHLYLDLKDDKSVLNGVIWKGVASRLKVKPEQGLEVVCTGKLTTFPGQSRYQIVIESMELAGVGALMALLEQRKKALAAEGLFDPAKKRPIPFLPETIGVVTSPSGAVICDILHRLRDRFPRHVLVWPVRVQGEQSAEEVTAAIKGFNNLKPGGPTPRPDLLIVARGGGSLEDLWSFNEETVVRAAAASDIPLISAVGHETDTTLIDFASDQRAPTPTAAAEMAVPVRADLVARVLDNARRLVRAETRKVTELGARLEGLSRGLPKPDDLFALPGQRLDHASQRLGLGLGAATSVKRGQLERIAGRLSGQVLASKLSNGTQRTRDLAARATRAEQRHLSDLGRRMAQAGRLLDTLSYQSVLSRGFALVRDDSGAPVRGSAAVSPGAALELEFAGADKLAVVAGATPDKPAVKPKTKRPVSKKKGTSANDQGRLF
ncbi:exodeoxyribonuclease VII large subunit [Parvibaculaceae bacterium PLY_AMNH_Bact1]|nr:exodeoxyribonuclease VII large subunit [Parvibaculaceae bacterium PLY_AMNH_Bact1]